MEWEERVLEKNWPGGWGRSQSVCVPRFLFLHNRRDHTSYVRLLCGKEEKILNEVLRGRSEVE